MVEKDENGKFAKGNRGGPGRPSREKETRFYEVMVSTVTLDDWKQIVKKAADQAKRGDGVARKWLADYLIGPPVQKLEHTGQDGSELVIRILENAPPD